MKKKLIEALLMAGIAVCITACGANAESAVEESTNTVEGDESDYLYEASSSLDEGEEELSSENDEAKYEYSDDEKEENPMFAFNIFIDVMKDCGIEFNMLNRDLYDERYTAEDFPDGEHSDLISCRKYDTSVAIPNENTVEWTKEKAEMFKEAGVTAFYAEGYSWGDDYADISLWLFIDETKALTTLETEGFFQSDVDLQIADEKESVYQEWLNSQQNN